MTIQAVVQSMRTQLAPEVLAMLRDTVATGLGDLSAELARLYQTKIPVYKNLDAELIAQNTRFVLSMLGGQLADGSSEPTTDGLIELAEMLADQGTPLEAVAHSMQLGGRLIVAIVRQRSLELGVPATEVDAFADLAWEWATEASSVVQAVQRELAIAGATRRADFVRRLTAGAMPPAVFAAEAASLGIDPDHRYHVACTAAEESRGGTDMLSALRIHGATADRPAVDAVIDGQLVALLPRRPDRKQWSRPIGIGPAVEPLKASFSYEQARRAWEIAERHDIDGLVDLAALGPLPLLDQAADAVSALEERHLAPLRDQPGGNEILATVGTYLKLDRRVDETARVLHVHRNTIRYRLTRFTAGTGLDLDRTDDIVLAWWLLNR
jgi:hypothetical protein